MRILKLSMLLLLSILLFSCSKDEGEDQENFQSYFEIDGIKYETTNAYLFFNKNEEVSLDPTVPSRTYYEAGFGILFADGLMNDGYLSTNTTNAVFLEYEDEEDESEYDTIEEVPISDLTYPLTDESNGLTNITEFENKEMIDGIEYGDVVNGDYFEANEMGLNIMTIESIDLDRTALTGTIKVNYTFETTTGKILTGIYEGSVKIIEDN